MGYQGCHAAQESWPVVAVAEFLVTMPPKPGFPTRLLDWPHRLVRSRTPGFHPGNRGSNPLGVIA